MAYEGILPLLDRGDLDRFEEFAPEPISADYRRVIRNAYDVASIITVIAVRGSHLAPADEIKHLDRFVIDFRASLSLLRSSLKSQEVTRYSEALGNLLSGIEALVETDLASLQGVVESGDKGWRSGRFKSLDALDPSEAATAGSDAEYIYSWSVITSQVEDDPVAARIL
ncbi:hypothetical protein [Curtobacterium sp. MCPF17_031]|uniref:hypothetical protein n=1 Tax=Curtobacterium sp. MCPF17_031 TaxID=2175653 RepID=UPI0011B6C584|nr:hypothetical protein [Curtobacterium sp. MCPF17_031]